MEEGKIEANSEADWMRGERLEPGWRKSEGGVEGEGILHACPRGGCLGSRSRERPGWPQRRRSWFFFLLLFFAFSFFCTVPFAIFFSILIVPSIFPTSSTTAAFPILVVIFWQSNVLAGKEAQVDRRGDLSCSLLCANTRARNGEDRLLQLEGHR